MDYKYIEQLLERYWECETSLQEESILRSFFAQDDVPSHLKEYQAIFQAENALSEERLSDDFDQRMMALVDDEADSRKVVKAKVIKMEYRIRPFFKAAAVVAIVLTLGMAVQQGMYSDSADVNAMFIPSQIVNESPETALDKNIESLADSLARLQDKTGIANTSLRP